MGNSLFEEMRGTAREILSEFGTGEIQYVRVTPGGGPKDDPGPPVETPFKLDGIPVAAKFKYVDGSTVVAKDMQITVPTRDDVEPEMSGFMKVDGARYKIKRIDPIPASGPRVANRIFFGK